MTTPSNTTTFQPRTVTCPSCSGPSLYSSDNIYRPFCSARCKNHDLGAWANEDFRLPAVVTRESDEADEMLQGPERLH
jgi:uncharacterized protein